MFLLTMGVSDLRSVCQMHGTAFRKNSVRDISSSSFLTSFYQFVVIIISSSLACLVLKALLLY